MDGRLLTPAEAAEQLAVPKQTLAVWRHRGVAPAFIKFGRTVRYDPSTSSSG